MKETDLAVALPVLSNLDLSPITAGPSPFFERLRYFLHLWGIKIVISILTKLLKTFRPGPPSTRPTIIKSYGCSPTLEHRVFFPSSWQTGSLIPLYLDIHGGGFAFGEPWFDDEFCSSWAKRTGMLVVSLSYRKSPTYRFPVPVQDIATVARAVIDDESLPIDKSRIVMGGFSAGGTLALSACQLPELKHLIKAVVPFYPVVDWSVPTGEKFRRRLYKERSADSLARIGQAFSWGYIPETQNRRDPVLSPIYAMKQDLPKWIFMVAPQHDLLTRESRNFIMHLAGIENLAGDEEFSFEREGYRWRLPIDVGHGFTHAALGTTEQQRISDQAQSEKVYLEIQDWLETGPLA